MEALAVSQVLLWIVVVVVRDIWQPEHDVVRQPPGLSRSWDDPTGGVLDRAPDVAWLPRPFGGVAAKAERSRREFAARSRSLFGREADPVT